MKYSFPAFENGFIRAAAASPALRVADCTYNADQIIGVMREYAEKNVQLLDRKSTRLNSSHPLSSRMPSSA